MKVYVLEEVDYDHYFRIGIYSSMELATSVLNEYKKGNPISSKYCVYDIIEIEVDQ